MSPDELEQYEADVELQLYREYRDISPTFSYVVETERRFYLANHVERTVRDEGVPYTELTLRDAWVWDMYRSNRFVSKVTVISFKDVNIEELPTAEIDLDQFRDKR